MSENVFDRMAGKYDKEERIALANTIAAEMKKYFPHDANNILLLSLIHI